MKSLAPLFLLCLLVPHAALAAKTAYTVDWSDLDATGVTIGTTKVTLTKFGGTSIYSSPESLYIGSSSINDARINFSRTTYEWCGYVTGQNIGETIKITTSAGGGETFYFVDTGSINTTLSGDTFTWDDVGYTLDAEINQMCVKSSSGFTWVNYDHEGTAGGLLILGKVYIDESPACTATTWYADGDKDGVGGSSTFSACSAPSGYVASTGDCDDTDPATYPGAPEVTGDEKDQSCDGKEVCFVDSDVDGWRTTGTVTSSDIDCDDSGEAAETAGLDCDDADKLTFPGASEAIGDGKDQSCDGKEACYVDADRDGARGAGLLASADLDCADPGEAGPGAAIDCDESDTLTFPGATEVVGDEKDQSCDSREVCFVDGDRDGARSTSTISSDDVDCRDSGEALAVAAIDCDDVDAGSFPGATEVVGDEKDQSCDGREVCYADTDEDGWRLSASVASLDADCADAGEARASEPAGDCNDTVRTVYPGATEVPYDDVDQDCNGEDLCDVDGDGFDADAGFCGGTDCADEDELVNPMAAEVWYDGIDGDCDGAADDDRDGDGFASAAYGGDDCADDDPAIFPDASEIWYDDIDQNCDDADDFDQDGDGFTAVRFGGEDCDDLRAEVFPGAEEAADGLDNDCDTYTELSDLDGDGVLDEDEQDLNLDPTSVDSDGDGTPDAVEWGPDTANPKDSDGDGIIDALDADDDGDGLPSAAERSNVFKTDDTDDDGKPDYLDLDSDGDGISDLVESLIDHDFDGVPTYLDEDADEDGFEDSVEGVEDLDGDGLPNFLDTDDDGDGWPSSLEGGEDRDGDGTADYLDADQDGDGKPDAEEALADVDCDDLIDLHDSDDADGPCQNLGVTSFAGGCSSVGGGSSALGLALLALLGLRRRRAA
jgi:uncharacterized protein (TIGR03382 family)